MKDSLLHNSFLRTSDSLRLDSVRLASLQADSLSKVLPPVRDTIRPALQHALNSDSFLLRKRLFFTFTDPVRYTVSERKWEGKDTVFYAVVALLLLFALIKNAFPRYLPDLYSAYFRTTVRQKQIKEQLVQNPLPSLFFNLFFVLSAAVFVSQLIQQFGYNDRLPFFELVLYSAGGIAAVYAAKFLLLKFFGWVFQLSEATDAYLFVVFSTNKILGIFLLPFTVLLAFTYGGANASIVTLSVVLVLALFIYRYFLAFISINHLVRINLFHFLLYLAAFEVLPLLLINKLLFTILREIA
ncbi:DUF4271 domain-containing protein [Flavisolibacter ginsenosidimutans]|uniref:DUF4271 domain-containing protein n=1 Tax=Flavisolibacter ginsenosidimutans TaxID=661481 RepID=A0A5B8UN09_9BACT|nr:DUF4271 domain-containing protein [Flavisolibacter ginsenosidimutans]QEC57752.1 DUF4271 domain-containing protein [Flavisolibacter ginsenosidimutans]